MVMRLGRFGIDVILDRQLKVFHPRIHFRDGTYHFHFCTRKL